MPEMQEQFPAIARDGVYAENAGAIFGGCLDGRIPKNEVPLLWNFWRMTRTSRAPHPR